MNPVAHGEVFVTDDGGECDMDIGNYERFLNQDISKALKSNIIFSIVRFGNVIGSSGSVVPLFMKQIVNGGPVTITHPNVTRYFMTIKEAVQLVLQSPPLSRGGDIFLLEMGEAVKIEELAKQMIILSGLKIKDENNPDLKLRLYISGGGCSGLQYGFAFGSGDFFELI